MNFSELNLDNTILEGLQALNFDETTPIQEQSYPIIAEGKDMVGVAQTGTGKTAAFVIPILQRIKDKIGDNKGTKALILAPTRELAQQIDEQIFAIGYHTGVSSALVIGGGDFAQQARAIKDKVDIIVATPGRLIDQMKITGMDLSQIDLLVLDEVDRMLDMGFIPDVTKIMNRLPDGRQNLLFSATMPGDIKKLINKFMKDPVYVEIEASKPAEQVTQEMYQVEDKQKLDLVAYLFAQGEWDSAIIFTATKKGTDQLYQLLKKKNIDAISIHGDRTQNEREEALRAFKNSRHPVIVATDVLSRGIDIDDVGAIINYDMPNSVEDYIHRVGRTGRYDKGGTAITFATSRDKRMISAIKKKVGEQLTVKDVPDEVKNSGKKQSQNRQQQKGKKEDKAGKKKDAQETAKPDKQKDTQHTNKTDKQKQSGKPDKQQDKAEAQEKEQVGKKKRAPRRIKKSRNEQNGKENQKGNGSDKSDKSGQQKKEQGKKPEKKVKGNTPPSNKSRDKNRKKQDSKKDKQSAESRKAKNSTTRGSKNSSGKMNKRTDEQDVLIVPERIKKATEKNKKTLKPAKGFWGIIKSMIPRIK